MEELYKKTVKEATLAQNANSPHLIRDAIPSIQRQMEERLPPPSTFTSTHDFLPSTENDEDFMDVDQTSRDATDVEMDSDSDNEGELVLEAEDASEKTEEDDLQEEINRYVQEIYGTNLDDLDLDNIFNFLPNEDDIELPNLHAHPVSAPPQPIQRSLIDDEDNIPVWDSKAGEVYGVDKDIEQRWRGISSQKDEEEARCYEPFASRLEWEVSPVLSSIFLPLKLIQVQERLGLTFNNSRTMLEKLDTIPDRAGPWFTKNLSFKDRPEEVFTIHHRDPVEAIKALWGDPSLARDLVYQPAKIFRKEAEPTEENRIFSEMWTGGFWNSVQRLIPEGGTLAPVILATDKTQLTQFSGNKTAYPVYLTLGNIPKELRRKPESRACVLIAYLSVDQPSKEGISKRQFKLRKYQLFHKSMAIILASLKKAGNPKGPGVKMVGGTVLFAEFILCSRLTLRTIQSSAWSLVPREPRTQLWTKKKIVEAQKAAAEGGKSVHSRTMEDDVAGGSYEPFWSGFPLADIHRCIAPDVLHQLYQGVLKHLIAWVQKLVGEEELDERIRRFPPAPGVRHFSKGISGLAQVSGTERKHMARILLACLKGKMDDKGITTCRSILHFIQLAQYPSHDQETLKYMKAELDTWDLYKDYFITEETRTHFNIPKFHSLIHYIDSIRWTGTTDNTNTEAFERLHIDFAKEGWRSSNKRDHFPQMIAFISRKEKVSSFDFYRSWSPINLNVPDVPDVPDEEARRDEDIKPLLSPLDLEETRKIKRYRSKEGKEERSSVVITLSKYPKEKRKKVEAIALLHGAPGFLAALKLFLNDQLPERGKKSLVLGSPLPFQTLEVWHNFSHVPLKVLDQPERSLIKAQPLSTNNRAARFDTVLVLENEEAQSTAVQGCRAARLRVIFRLPQTVGLKKAPASWPKEHLAYVTWYSRFKSTPDPATGMYKIEPAIASNGVPQGAIIPLADIRQSCMLVPSRTNWDSSWKSENILDECPSFFVNNLQTKYTYQTIY
ncbi:hypothetical protein EV361DRAFT_975920 [Lentinula raphanica]|nr:hypothetical protein EV361DRAFT_975920 [Lentinula raphanica]